MATSITRKILLFIIIGIAQALVFNNVRLFNCATPFLTAYFVAQFALGETRTAMLLWCFCLGLSIDIISNTPGLAASSLTFGAFMQPYILGLFTSRDQEDKSLIPPSSLKTARYVAFAFIMSLVTCATFYSLEAFQFDRILQWAENVAGSTLLTFAFMIAFNSFARNKRQ